MINREWAQQFADQWIAAFNSHDLERIINFYSDDFTLTSPHVREQMDVETGTLKGKDEIRPYWQKSLAVQPPLLFVLKDVFVGIDSVAIYYESLNREMVCDTFSFNCEGRIVSFCSHRGRAAKQTV